MYKSTDLGGVFVVLHCLCKEIKEEVLKKQQQQQSLSEYRRF